MNIKPSEITPKDQYLSRRDFIKSAGLLAGTSALLAACAVPPAAENDPTRVPTEVPAMPSGEGANPEALSAIEDLSAELTPFEAVTNFNNFYENY